MFTTWTPGAHTIEADIDATGAGIVVALSREALPEGVLAEVSVWYRHGDDWIPAFERQQFAGGVLRDKSGTVLSRSVLTSTWAGRGHATRGGTMLRRPLPGDRVRVLLHVLRPFTADLAIGTLR